MNHHKPSDYSDRLKELLLNLWKQQKLSHFYLLSPTIQAQTRHQNIQDLKDWTSQFLSQIIALEMNITSDEALSKINSGIGDILWITPRDKKSYTMETGEFREFTNFLKFKNLSLKNRFIIVEQTDRINRTLLNKLLKDLEEPTANTTIFFLNPSHKMVLETIKSRAISLTIAGKTQINREKNQLRGLDDLKRELEKLLKDHQTSLNSEDQNCLNFLLDVTTKMTKQDNPCFEGNLLSYSLLQYKNQKISEEVFLSWWMDLESKKKTSYLQKKQTLKILEWVNEMKTYHNPINPRLSETMTHLFKW